MINPTRILILFALVVGVLAGASLLPATQSNAATRQVTGGDLTWGVKQQFRDYIIGIAEGTITPSGGVTVNPDGTFNFPQATGTADLNSDDASIAFDGTVQFVGHEGLLDLTITEVRLEIDGGTGRIIADVTSRDLDTGNFIPYPDVDLVNLSSITPVELPASLSWSNMSSILTTAAAPAFEGFYTGGVTAFDPASADVDLDGVGSMTWKVSQYAWTQTSLAQAHGTDAPAAKDPVNGFVFPSWNVTLDTTDGSLDASFDGALILGNTAAGNFRIKLANPHIIITDAGAGSLRADVSHCLPGCTGTYVGLSPNTLITTFDYSPAAVSVANGVYTWTLTPHWSTVGNQFAQAFIDALPASMQNFFRASGSGLDPQKPPAPITVAFDTWACGADIDCDGLSPADNCAALYNPNQANFDGDAQGDVCDADDDNDKCSDAAEAGPSHVLGGQRDPFNMWDFFDVTGDSTVDLLDTLNVLSYFGANGGGPSNLRDRSIPDSNFPWRTAEANNGIDLVDALNNLKSFGDHC